MSFILDALRKSEHERQRSALPSLAHVPIATRPAEIPRWVLLVMGGLVAAVLVLGGAWWTSTRGDDAGVSPTTRTVEVPLPAPAEARAPAPLTPPASPRRAPSEADRPAATSLAATARVTLEAESPVTSPAAATAAPPAETASSAEDEATLPSAAALAAEGVALPALRLELHAYSENRGARFVFINGRRYLEGERLPEGAELVAIEARGAVLRYLGHRFLLVPE